jgi:hypothetical protein
MATIQEAADYLNVSTEYFIDMIRHKRITSFWGYIRQSDLEKLKQEMIDESNAAMYEVVRVSQEIDCY